ncbi:MAG: alpha/beta fold hydrolase [Alphaproteobacteria bacterium]
MRACLAAIPAALLASIAGAAPLAAEQAPPRHRSRAVSTPERGTSRSSTCGDEKWFPTPLRSILVLQPTQDVLAPAENAEQLRKQEGDRVTVVYVDRAGHALLSEQPEAIASHVSEYLARLCYTGRAPRAAPAEQPTQPDDCCLLVS